MDEVHTPSGAHQTIEIPFPEWIPAEDLDAAALLSVDEALALSSLPALTVDSTVERAAAALSPTPGATGVTAAQRGWRSSPSLRQ